MKVTATFETAEEIQIFQGFLNSIGKPVSTKLEVAKAETAKEEIKKEAPAKNAPVKEAPAKNAPAKTATTKTAKVEEKVEEEAEEEFNFDEEGDEEITLDSLRAKQVEVLKKGDSGKQAVKMAFIKFKTKVLTEMDAKHYEAYNKILDEALEA